MKVGGIDAIFSGFANVLNPEKSCQPALFLTRQKMSTNYENLIVEMGAPVARVTLNRPERRNALAGVDARIDGLFAGDRRIGRDARFSLRRRKRLSSGHDLTEMRGRSVSDYRRIFDACVEMMNAVQSVPQPVIAEVQGMATAASANWSRPAIWPSQPKRPNSPRRASASDCSAARRWSR